MLFILAQLGWESKADEGETLTLCLALGGGVLWFVAKFVMQWVLTKAVAATGAPSCTRHNYSN